MDLICRWSKTNYIDFRALLNKNSKMIVMDEPTSALDSKNTKLS